MSDIVERVARAIYDAELSGPPCKWEEATPSDKAEYEHLARAALAAMPQEPIKRIGAWLSDPDVKAAVHRKPLVPMAWMYEWKDFASDEWEEVYDIRKPSDRPDIRNIRPLYASPPLPTREEIAAMIYSHIGDGLTTTKLTDAVLSLFTGASHD